MKPTILALDVEGTLLVTQGRLIHPRPGLFAFLEWALDSFERVPVYTMLSEGAARFLFEQLATQGLAPPEFLAQFEFTDSTPLGKDLNQVPRAELEAIRLVDDSPGNILSEQRHLWLPIATYRPARSSAFGAAVEEPDHELDRIRKELEIQLA